MEQHVSPGGHRYKTETYRTTIPVALYLKDFYTPEECIAACKKCSQYGNRWGCPPFSIDTKELLRPYQQVELVAVRIEPADKGLPLSLYEEFLAPEKQRIETELLDREKRCEGMVCGHVGKCTHCGDLPCTRLTGKPCRHPEKVRPSLESLGFDVTKTMSGVFGMPIEWGKEGKLPSYLTLVSALFF